MERRRGAGELRNLQLGDERRRLLDIAPLGRRCADRTLANADDVSLR